MASTTSHHQHPPNRDGGSTPPPAPLRVAVLTASYAESDCELKESESVYEADPPPGLFFAPLWPPAKFPHLAPDPDPGRYVFEVLKIHKRTAYRQIRDAVKSGKYDCFFNLCDGAKDEARAGVEVLHALEEFGVPFTGATSKHFEPSKADMKRIAHYHGIRTARGCVVDDLESVPSKCRRMNYPVIVKHVSGYSSIGMTKDAKCASLEALLEYLKGFLQRFSMALVEEFVEGEEVTVLACGDLTKGPNGIKVYPAVQMRFPEGEEWKHFDLKWAACDDISWHPMDPNHPAYNEVLRVGGEAFKCIMGGIGYGRSDLRIDKHTGQVVFLELNPNCGIFYPYGEEGSADWILRVHGPNGQGHRDFISLQIATAIARRAPVAGWPYNVDCVLDDDLDLFVLEAKVDIPAGARVLADAADNRLHVYLPESDVAAVADDDDEAETVTWPVDVTGKDPSSRPFAVAWGSAARWGGIPDSVNPTLTYVGKRRTILAATRDIRRGERLTLDYRQLGQARPDFRELVAVAEATARQTPATEDPTAQQQFPLSAGKNNTIDEADAHELPSSRASPTAPTA